MIETDGDFQGFYISLDFGSTWTVVPTATSTSMSQSTFGWWFGRLWVDPADQNNWQPVRIPGKPQTVATP